MKNYESRAIKMGMKLCGIFAGCATLDDFEWTARRYNRNHKRPLKWDSGVSRITFLFREYVIKFDYKNQSSWWADGRAGSCDTEVRFYMERACKDHMEHLFARPTYLSDRTTKRTFEIMPFIDGVDDWHRDWEDYCSYDERVWLRENLNDLHEGNVGYLNGKTCIIDYAWSRDEPTFSFSISSFSEPEELSHFILS